MKRAKRPGEGRPTKYKPEYCEAIIKFFSVAHSKFIKIITTGKNDYRKEEEKEIANPLPFLSGFARSINVNTDTLHEWVKVHKEFSDAFTRAKELQAEMLHANTLKNLYNANYGIFTAQNITEWRQKVGLEHGLPDEAYERLKTMPVAQLAAEVAVLFKGLDLSQVPEKK